jgi:hypothetical protein
MQPGSVPFIRVKRLPFLEGGRQREVSRPDRERASQLSPRRRLRDEPFSARDWGAELARCSALKSSRFPRASSLCVSSGVISSLCHSTRTIGFLIKPISESVLIDTIATIFEAEIFPQGAPSVEAVPSNWARWIAGPKAGAALGPLVANSFFPVWSSRIRRGLPDAELRQRRQAHRR